MIAAGLHDGVVQELAGHSFQMAAAVEQDQPPAELRARARGRRGRHAQRDPPAALAAARDLPAGAARPGAGSGAARRGRPADGPRRRGRGRRPGRARPSHRRRAARVPHGAGGDPQRRRARGRRARHASASAQTNGTGDAACRATTGAASTPTSLARRRLEGHMGLAMLQDLAETAGGRLRVDVAAGRRHDRRARGGRAVIRVVVIDDHTIVRNGLVQLLRLATPTSRSSAPRGDGEAAVALCLEHASRRRADGPLDAGDGRRRGHPPDRRAGAGRPGRRADLVHGPRPHRRRPRRRRDRLPAEGRGARAS